MHDLFVSLFLLIVLVSLYINICPKKYYPQEKSVSTPSPRINHYIIPISNKSTIIDGLFEKELLEIYNSDIINKRDLLVKRLDEMSRVVDLGVFFDKYNFIHDYIFCRYK